jgi:hypothetical protein
MIIATIVVVLAFYGMVKFKDYGDSLLAQAPTSKCPKEEIGVEEAYLDSLLNVKQRNAKLHCFCKKVYVENGGDVSSTLPLF